MTPSIDYLVIGSGIAGLTFALKAAEHGSVAIVTKNQLFESSTHYAQGGIAAVVDPSDTFDGHVEDTLTAGDGLCNEAIVRLCVEDGPKRIEELAALGVEFSRKTDDAGNQGQYDLGREGGHHARRVLHAGDITGRAVERALVAAARTHPNIHIFEHHTAVNLITSNDLDHTIPRARSQVLGAYVLDKVTADIRSFVACFTILATGGVGKVYLYTSNPDVATGDGVAMAYRAGAKVANMEFVQFHPTCLYHPRAKNFLISEALRGEGGKLRTASGEAFMKRYHELGSLAPRDIVARAIDKELKTSGDDSVFLDMTHLSRDFIESRFPNIHAECLRFGIDMVVEPIPVVPAAHYSCGGVVVGRDGETTVPNLLALGEVSCTGLHGANRLASNSLLEGAVFAVRAAQYVRERIDSARMTPVPAIPPWDPGPARPSEEAVIVSQNWDELRRVMWNYVGIVRNTRRLLRARSRLDLFSAEINEYYWEYLLTSDLIELRNLATAARLIVECALRRRESRGLHYTLDYPERDDENWRKDTVVDRLMLEGR